MVFNQSRQSFQYTQQSVFITDKNYALQSRCKSVLRVTVDFSPKKATLPGCERGGPKRLKLFRRQFHTSDNILKFFRRNRRSLILDFGTIYGMTQLAFRTKISSTPDGIYYQKYILKPKELFQTAHVPPLYVLLHSKILFGLNLPKYTEIHRI